jgi:hypothetical protein
MNIKEITEKVYLNFQESHPNTPIFHDLRWIQSVSEVYPVKSIFLGIFDDAGIITAFPVYLKKALFGTLSLAGSPLPQIGTSPASVAFDSNGINIIEAIDQLKNWKKAARIHYFQMTLPSDFLKTVSVHKLPYEQFDNLEISLDSPLEEIWKKIKGRRSHAQMQQPDLELVWLSKEQIFPDYQRLLKSTYQDMQNIEQNFPIEMHQKLLQTLFGSQLKILGGFFKDQLISMIWVLFDKRKCYWWDSASDQNMARKTNINRLIHWEVIKWAKDKGLESYDLLGRSANSGRSGFRPGISTFKLSLGAQKKDYLKLILSSQWMLTGIDLYRKYLSWKNSPQMMQSRKK